MINLFGQRIKLYNNIIKRKSQILMLIVMKMVKTDSLHHIPANINL